jgi:pilus assembly protein Flp/PilA
MKRLLKILRNDEGAAAIEYAVLLALILIAIVGAIGSLGTENGGMWGGVQNDLTDVGFMR